MTTSKAHQPNADALLRVQAAATTRLLVMEGLLDYSGHVAVRAPGRDAFFIQSALEPRSDVSPDSMLLIGFDGKVIEGDARPPVEIAIHIEIFKARPDVEAIVHSHMELAIWFTMMEGVQLVPMRARSILAALRLSSTAAASSCSRRCRRASTCRRAPSSSCSIE
jgi:ribulose-5-phosphate 4-epimerase/fuculose-1-phosphate aldolase